MKIIQFILYQPYLFWVIYLLGNFYQLGRQHSLREAISTTALLLLNIVLIAFLFFKLLQKSLLRAINNVRLARNVPDSVLAGYLFLFTLINPILAILVALFAKLFIWEETNEKPYIDEYGNTVTQLNSPHPTIILSRKKQTSGEEEHIVMTKLKKKPRKVLYE